MKQFTNSTTRQWLSKTAACLLAFMMCSGPVWGIGNLATIDYQNASFTIDDNRMIVDVDGQRSVINWSNFNTTQDGILEFQSGSSSFAVLNRILSGAQTQFDGTLQGNHGHIIVINQHGIVFGPDATVTAGRFTASTLGLEMSDTDFLAGSDNFTFATGTAQGKIELLAGAEISADRVELLAHKITNRGTIGGTGDMVILAAGDRIYLASDSNIIVEIDLPNTSEFNYRIANEATGEIRSETGRVVFAAGDTFAQALGVHNLAYAAGDYNVEQRGTVEAAELEIGAAQQIALRSSGSTEANTIRMAAQRIDIQQPLSTTGDMTIDAENHVRATENLYSGGDMTIIAHKALVQLQGQAYSEGTMDVAAGTDLVMMQGASSEGTMNLSADNRVISLSDLATWADMTITANETITNADILAADDLSIDSDLSLIGSTDQHIASSSERVHLAGTVHKPNPGSIYIDAEKDIRLDGDVASEAGGVSVISQTGRIHTGQGAALNIQISGYSNDLWENSGADLPFKGGDGESLGKAAIVLQSQDGLILGSGAGLYAAGAYAALENNGQNGAGVDDRPGVNFLDQDAVIGGYDRDAGIPIDVAIYIGSTDADVHINEGATISVGNNSEIGDATVVLDAYDTVSMPDAGVLTGEFRLEAASRMAEWLYQVEGDNQRLPDLAAVEAVLGEGNYIRRGAGRDNPQIVSDGQAWVLENPTAEAAPLAVLEVPQLSGCPVEMQAAAAEIGISPETLQMSMRNALAMNPNIQPCDSCARLITAATTLSDRDGVHLAAMNEIFNTLAPPDVPFTPEVSASVVTAFAQLGDQDRQYALAAEYIDAFVQYVAVLDTELMAPVDDPVMFAIERYGEPLIGEEANPNIVAYILAQVMPEAL